MSPIFGFEVFYDEWLREHDIGELTRDWREDLLGMDVRIPAATLVAGAETLASRAPDIGKPPAGARTPQWPAARPAIVIAIERGAGAAQAVKVAEAPAHDEAAQSPDIAAHLPILWTKQQDGWRRASSGS